MLARFSAEVRCLTDADIVGFRPVSSARKHPEANHASATAIDIMESAYGVAAEDVFTRTEQLLIGDIVKDCGGTVGWSRDTNASHFFIAHPPNSGALRKVAERLLADRELPAAHARVHRQRG